MSSMWSRFRPWAYGRKIRLGYDETRWSRRVMDESVRSLLAACEPESADVLEISGIERMQLLSFKSYRNAEYPEFDICKDRLDEQFDIIIANQVFEHLLYPYRAGKNVYEMLRPGGHFLVTTPSLLKVHECPYDCSRWTEEGLRRLLEECGWELDHIETGSWGNRKCAVAGLLSKTWPVMGWGKDLTNEEDFPVVVWALAQKAPEGAECRNP